MDAKTTTKKETTMAMRRQLIEAKTRKQAARLAPWASVLIKVDGGWMAFESVSDADRWRAQK